MRGQTIFDYNKGEVFDYKLVGTPKEDSVF